MINFLNDIGYPAFPARPSVITFADAPTGEPFPPRHAPRARDHHTGISVGCWTTDLKSVPEGNTACAVSITRGIMLATKGMLSTIAELIAENHKVVIAVTNMFPAFGFVSEIILSERLEIKPTLMTPPTIMKRPIKKKIVGHSSSLSTWCGSSFDIMSRMAAPIIDRKSVV